LFAIADTYLYLSFYEQQAFLRAGQINPDYYGEEGATVARSAYTDSWDIRGTPGQVGIITKVEVDTITGSPDVAAGDEVNLIDVRFALQALAPRVYYRGGKLYGYGADLGSVDADMATKLKLWYSYVPVALTTATQTISIEDEWSPLIITPLAAILALADQRPEDYDRLMLEYQRDLQSFLTHVATNAYGILKPLGQVPPPSITFTGGQ
jgi:hypothetical protein